MSTYTPFTRVRRYTRTMNSSNNSEINVNWFTMPANGFIIVRDFQKIEGENIAISCSVFCNLNHSNDDLVNNQVSEPDSLITFYECLAGSIVGDTRTDYMNPQLIKAGTQIKYTITDSTGSASASFTCSLDVIYFEN
jgi:hypothetical protein